MKASALAALAFVHAACSSSGDDNGTSASDAGDATVDGTSPGSDAGFDGGADATTNGDSGSDAGGADAQDAGNDAPTDSASAPDAPPSTGARCNTGSRIYEAGDGNLRGLFTSLYWYSPLGDGGSEEHFCFSGTTPSSCQCGTGSTCVLPNACPAGAPCGLVGADGIPGNNVTGICF